MTQVDTVAVTVSDDPEDAPFSWVRVTLNLRDGTIALMDIGHFASREEADQRIALLRQALTPATFDLEE
jgi:hypothetical protein